MITSDIAQCQSFSSSRINLPSGVSADEIDIQVCIIMIFVSVRVVNTAQS